MKPRIKQHSTFHSLKIQQSGGVRCNPPPTVRRNKRKEKNLLCCNLNGRCCARSIKNGLDLPQSCSSSPPTHTHTRLRAVSDLLFRQFYKRLKRKSWKEEKGLPVHRKWIKRNSGKLTSESVWEMNEWRGWPSGGRAAHNRKKVTSLMPVTAARQDNETPRSPSFQDDYVKM